MALYKITLPDNNQIEIDVPGGWATEDTLSTLTRSLRAGQDKFSKTTADFNKAVDPSRRGSMGASAKKAGASLEEFEQELTSTQKALQGLDLAINTVGDVAGSLLQSTGKLTDINPLVDTVTSRMGKFSKGVLGNFEIFGLSIGGVAEGTLQLAKDMMILSTTVGQRVVDTFDGLTQAGVGTAYNFTNLGETLAELRISGDTLTKVVRENAMVLSQLGEFGDIESGLNKFQNSLGIVNNELRLQFRALGFSTDEAAMFFADFIDSNKRGLMLRAMDERELASASLNYGKNLQILAELTGKNIDQVRSEMQSQQMAAGAELTLARLERQGAEGVVNAFNAVKVGVPDAFKPVVDQLLKFDTAIGDQAILNVASGDAIQFLNRELDNLAYSNMSLQERQNKATEIVAKFNQMIADSADGPASAIAEFAGVIPSGELDTLAGAFLDAETQVRRFVDTVGGDELLKSFRSQQADLMETVRMADTALGSYVNTVVKIEDARMELESMLFANMQTTFDLIVDKTGDFYSMLAYSLGLKTPTVSNSADIKGEEGSGSFYEKYKQFDLNGDGQIMGDEFRKLQEYLQQQDIAGTLQENAYGGELHKGLSLVGERGPELLKIGSGAIGKVFNNTDTRNMIAPVNNVLNNLPSLLTNMQAIVNDTLGPDGINIENMANQIGTAMKESIDRDKMDPKKVTFDTGRVEQSLQSLGITDQNSAVMTELKTMNKNLKAVLLKAFSGNGHF